MKDTETSSNKSFSILVGLSSLVERIKDNLVNHIPEEKVKQLQIELFRKSASDKIIQSEIEFKKR